MSELGHQFAFPPGLRHSHSVDAALDLFFGHEAQQPVQTSSEVRSNSPWKFGQDSTPSSLLFAPERSILFTDAIDRSHPWAVTPDYLQGIAQSDVAVAQAPLAVSRQVPLHDLPGTGLFPVQLTQSSVTQLPAVQPTTFPDTSPAVQAAPPLSPQLAQSSLGEPLSAIEVPAEHTGSYTGNDSKEDPHAAAFLRQILGERQWEIFSARLAGRRVNLSKRGSKIKSYSHRIDSEDANEANGGGCLNDRSTSVVDFLLKVEVVKSVLRAYIPHPYNPFKSLVHTYAPAPSGHVTLSRSSVLALCGWSNTQFSYWARRSEAVSVLAKHDKRLQAIARALEQQLRAVGITVPPRSAALSPVSSESKDTSADVSVTGKGLDTIIDEVKKRSGASPFLRGRHSSLDPFGARCDDKYDGKPSTVAAALGPPASGDPPAFQANTYVHDPADEGHNRESLRSSEHATDGETSVGTIQSPVVSMSEGEGSSPSVVPKMQSECQGLSILGVSPPPAAQVSIPLVLPAGASQAPTQACTRRRRLTSPLRMQTLDLGLLPFPTVSGHHSEEGAGISVELADLLDQPRKKRRSI